MTEVTIHAAKTQLSKLIARAEAGEEVLIVRGREREPVAKLVPVREPAQPRTPGSLKGLIHVPDSFFDPLPNEELGGMGSGLMRARYLLDTHALLWWVLDTPRLSPTAHALIADPANDVYVSAASAWEIATKHRLGKLEAGPLATAFVPTARADNLKILSIKAVHAQLAGGLAGAHGDPFDRMLMAQSLSTGMPLVSNDTVFDQYGVTRVW